MRISRRLMLLLACSALLLAPLLTVQLATGAGRAHACDCRAPDTYRGPRRGLRRLLGEVVPSKRRIRGRIGRIRFRDRRRHGLEGARSRIHHCSYTGHRAECGYPGFELGEDYVVYARRGGRDSTSFCSRTRPSNALCRNSGTVQSSSTAEESDWKAPDSGDGARGNSSRGTPGPEPGRTRIGRRQTSNSGGRPWDTVPRRQSRWLVPQRRTASFGSQPGPAGERRLWRDAHGLDAATADPPAGWQRVAAGPAAQRPACDGRRARACLLVRLARLPPPLEALEEADAVFSGTGLVLRDVLVRPHQGSPGGRVQDSLLVGGVRCRHGVEGLHHHNDVRVHVVWT